MKVIMSNEVYSDTLLALGIHIAFDASVQVMNFNFVFGDESDEPIQFPTIADENEDIAPPFTYHRFKAKAVNSFGGKTLLAMLEKQWNTLQPTYSEVAELLLNPFGVDFTSHRLLTDAKKPYSQSATFRPLEMKGFNATKANGLGSLSTLKEFWLKDALRAIGFLTYAQPKLHLRDSQTNRWLVFMPAVPDTRFSNMMLHMPSFDVASATQVWAHTVASELNIAHIVMVRYAELNSMARTFIDRAIIEPRALRMDTINQLRKVLTTLSQGATSTELHQASSLILDVIEKNDYEALAKLQMKLASYAVNGYMKQLDTNAIEDLMTCEHIRSSHAKSTV